MARQFIALGFLLASACGNSDAGAASASTSTEALCLASATTQEEVTVANGFGELHGTWTLPVGCAPAPAVLIIAGSGPTDRDGNQGSELRPDTYRLVAEALAARGVSTLRYDKAGIGESLAAGPGREDLLQFEMGAEDAAVFVEHLRGDERVSSVIVAGHSEGSLLGMLVAERAAIEGLASIAGAGRAIADILRAQLRAAAQGPENAVLLAQAEAIITELEAGRSVAEVPAPLALLFRPSVQPYLMSWMRYDPAREITTVSAPLLIAQGTNDIQISVEDAERLAAARPDAERLIIEGMTHTLKASTLDPADQGRTYTDPTLPVVPELVEHLAAFARSVTASH